MESIRMDRRTFVGAMAAAGALSVAGTGLIGRASTALADDAEFPAPTVGQPVEAKVDPVTGELTINEDVVVRYSTCLGCYCDCGNRVKIDRETGRVLSVGGNPYHVNSCYPCLPFETPLEDAYRSMSYANGYGNATHGTICARGQGTWDMYNQPDRITMPLKRAGKRGEGKWKPISSSPRSSRAASSSRRSARTRRSRACAPSTTPRRPSIPSVPTWAPSRTRCSVWAAAPTAAP